MKKNTLFFLPVFFLMLTGCGPKAPAREPLGKPVITVKTDKTGLTWEAVEGAVSYQVTVNQGQPQTVTDRSYTFSDAVGNYSVSVVAVADEAKYNSEAASYTYETKAAAIGELSAANGAITWASAVGNGIEANYNGGLYADVSGTSVTATNAGVYTLRAKTGYDVTNKKNYVAKTDSVRERSILVQKPATATLVLEDGSEATSADVKDKYVIEKYGDSGWAVSENADLTLTEENAGYTEGKAVKIKFFKHSADFRYKQTPVTFSGSYDTLGFTIKGDPDAKFKVSLAVGADTNIAGQNLKGVFASYEVNFPANWTKYTVTLDDPNWVINYNNRSISFADVQTALAQNNLKVEKFADLLPYFNTVSFLCKCQADANWSTCYGYIDDFGFANTGATASSSERLYKPTALEQAYSLKADGVHGQFAVSQDGTAAQGRVKSGTNLITMSVALALNAQERTLKVTSTATGMDFVLNLTTDDGGETWQYVSATGTLADAVNHASMAKIDAKVLDDFSSYTETGTGYDANHKDPTAATGLRKEYFADYYSGNNNNTSPVGGNGWSLMGSTDYLNLDKNGAHVTPGIAKIKGSSAGNMRYMSAGLAATALTSGHAEAIGTGYSKMGFAFKGSANRDITIKVFAYYRDSISPSTQQSDRNGGTDVVIKQNSAWQNVEITLDPAKTYYGFAIIVVKTAASDWLLLDDIAMYNGANPFGL